jgi:hypothetical protein
LGNETAEMKKRRQRRSKVDPEGRNFRCDDCGKSYLSHPAMMYHRKVKHGLGDGDEKKGRGRPRKIV